MLIIVRPASINAHSNIKAIAGSLFRSTAMKTRLELVTGAASSSAFCTLEQTSANDPIKDWPSPFK
jgi:hypothetical protein